MLKFVIIFLYFSYYVFTALSAPIIKASGVQWSEPKGSGKGNITLIMIPQNNSCGNDSDMIVAVKSDYQVLSQDMQLLNLVVNDNECTKSTTSKIDNDVDKCTTLNECSVEDLNNDRMKNPNKVKYFETANKIDEVLDKNYTGYERMETTIGYSTLNIFKLLGVTDTNNPAVLSNHLKEYPYSSTSTNSEDILNLFKLLSVSESGIENIPVKKNTDIHMGTGVTPSLINFNDALHLLQSLNHPSENNHNKNFITNDLTDNDEIKGHDDSGLLESRIKDLKEENLALASDDGDSTKELGFPDVSNSDIANEEENSGNSLANGVVFFSGGKNDTFNLGRDSGVSVGKGSQLSGVGNDKLILKENSNDGISKYLKLPIGKNYKFHIEGDSSNAVAKVLGLLGFSNIDQCNLEGNSGISFRKGQGHTDIDNSDKSGMESGNLGEILSIEQGLSQAAINGKSIFEDSGNGSELPSVDNLNIMDKNAGDSLVIRSGLGNGKINKFNPEANSGQDLGKESGISGIEINARSKQDIKSVKDLTKESVVPLASKNDQSNLEGNSGGYSSYECLPLFASFSSQSTTENLLTITDTMVPVITSVTDHPSALTNKVEGNTPGSLVPVQTIPIFHEGSGTSTSRSSQSEVLFHPNFISEVPQAAKGYTTVEQLNALPNCTTIIVQCNSTTDKGSFEEISQMVFNQVKINKASTESEIVTCADDHHASVKLEVNDNNPKKITLDPPIDCETYLKVKGHQATTLNVIDHEPQFIEKNLALPLVESSVFLANNNEMPKGQGVPVVLNTSLNEFSLTDLHEKSDPIHEKSAQLYSNNNNQIVLNIEDGILSHSSSKPLEIKQNDKRKILLKTSNIAKNRFLIPDIGQILKMKFEGRNLILEQNPSYRSGMNDIVCETTPKNNIEHSESDTGPDDEENVESQLNIPTTVTTTKHSETELQGRQLVSTLQVESTTITQADSNSHHKVEDENIFTTLKTSGGTDLTQEAAGDTQSQFTTLELTSGTSLNLYSNESLQTPEMSTAKVALETSTIFSTRQLQSSPVFEDKTDFEKAGVSLQTGGNENLPVETTSTNSSTTSTNNKEHQTTMLTTTLSLETNTNAQGETHLTGSISTRTSNDGTETLLSSLQVTESTVLSTDETESSHEETLSSIPVSMSTNYKKTTKSHTYKHIKTTISKNENNTKDSLPINQISTTSSTNRSTMSSESSDITTTVNTAETSKKTFTQETPATENPAPSTISQNKQIQNHQCEKNMYIPANSVKEIVIQIIRNTKKPGKSDNSKINCDHNNNFVMPKNVNFAQKYEHNLPQAIPPSKIMLSNENTESKLNIPLLNVRPEMDKIKNRHSDAKSKNLSMKDNFRKYQQEDMQRNINNPANKIYYKPNSLASNILKLMKPEKSEIKSI